MKLLKGFLLFFVSVNGDCSATPATPKLALDGTCVAGGTIMYWQKDWKDCEADKNLADKMIRKRIAQTAVCEVNAAATEAPWLTCTKTRAMKTETCNNDLGCVDPNSTYDSATGLCTCNDGLYDSTYGCLSVADATPYGCPNKRVSSDMCDSKFENGAIIGSVLDKIDSLWTKSGATVVTTEGVGKLLAALKKVAEKRFAAMCGIKSRRSISNLVAGYESLTVELARITALTDAESITALGDSIKLLDQVLKLTQWNCKNSGYGWDTSDLSTDANGVTCPTTNTNDFGDVKHMQYMKCRVQVRLHKLYMDIFKPTNQLWADVVLPTKDD